MCPSSCLIVPQTFPLLFFYPSSLSFCHSTRLFTKRSLDSRETKSLSSISWLYTTLMADWFLILFCTVCIVLILSPDTVSKAFLKNCIPGFKGYSQRCHRRARWFVWCSTDNPRGPTDIAGAGGGGNWGGGWVRMQGILQPWNRWRLADPRWIQCTDGGLRVSRGADRRQRWQGWSRDDRRRQERERVGGKSRPVEDSGMVCVVIFNKK